jgi:hypothetical protein
MILDDLAVFQGLQQQFVNIGTHSGPCLWTPYINMTSPSRLRYILKGIIISVKFRAGGV